MEVREINATLNLRHEAEPRSPGRHVSEVISQIATSMGLWKRDDQEDLDFTLAKYHQQRGDDIIRLYPQAIYRIANGLAWESWYGPQMPEINFHSIGEIRKDGIIGTPDGLQFTETRGLVHEIKWTQKSSRSDRETPQERLRSEYYWTCQGCSYCNLCTVGPVKTWRQNGVTLASDNLVTTAVFHIMWSNGNYRGSGPELRVYEVEYTPEEVLANWKLIRMKSGQMDQEETK